MDRKEKTPEDNLMKAIENQDTIMTAHISPDKEMWERAGFSNYPRYEYIPLPKEVARMLKRKYKDFVLMSYNWTDEKGAKVAFLEYISYDGMNVHRGPGYCCDRIDDPDMWSQLARSLAMDNIHLQTRSFKKEFEKNKKYEKNIL